MSNAQSCDVLVVGAGFSGITVARELSRRGYQVVVLEGRDRIGGRTWYKDEGLPGRSLEMGGTWVHWFQPHVFAEITRYGLELVESIGVAEPEMVVTVAAGRRASVPFAEAWPTIESVMQRIGQDSREVLDRPYEPFLRQASLVERDKFSIQDRIDSLDLSSEERDLANGLWSLFSSAPCREVGLVTALRWYALSGWDIGTFFDAVARYKLRKGTRALIECIAGESAAEIHLNTAVTTVDQSAEAVSVRTREGELLQASCVVVTAPLNTLSSITFTPELSELKRAGISEGQASRGSKLWVQVRGKLPKPFFAVAPDNYDVNYVHTEELLDDGQFLVGFGPDGAGLDVNDLGQVNSAVRALLGEVEVIATAGHDWVSDEFSRGTWPMLRPGQSTRILANLQEPEGRVFFAGSETANGWNGFIDGAIESGFRVSRAVDAALAELRR